MPRRNIVILLFLCLAVALPGAETREMWHHATSPYRAVFNIRARPSHPRSGIAIQVPTCGLGMPEGEDVYCFDERGKQLPRMNIGPSVDNTVLVTVQAAESKRIYAYFGSKMPAPKADILPPFMCEIRTLPEGEMKSWPQVEALVRKSRLLGILPLTKSLIAGNPVDSRDRLIVVYTGQFHVRRAMVLHPYFASEGAGYLFWDGKLIHERKADSSWGSANRGQQHKDVEVAAGLIPVRAVGVKVKDGMCMFGIAQAFMAGGKVTANRYIEGADFALQGSASLVEVEAKNVQTPAPAFSCKRVSYMAVDDDFLNEVELETYSGQEATWKFGDGLTLHGAKVTRVVAGVDSLEVKASVKKQQAIGMICFPETDFGRERKASVPSDYEYYGGLLMKQGFKSVDDWRTLALMLRFFEKRDFHPSQYVVAEALLAAKSVPGEVRQEALLCVARAGAAKDPEQAKTAYEKLLKREMGKDERVTLLEEAVEFAVFGSRDMELARHWLEKYGKGLKASSKAVTRMRMDMALQSGDVKTAQELYTDLLEGRNLGARQRETAVRGISLKEEAVRALKEDRLLEAHGYLCQWAGESPIDRGNGSFSIVRAEYFRKRGWLDGALGELDGAILTDPLLPNLPDVEYLKAQIYEQARQFDKAVEIYRKIMMEYPNHMAAPWARDALKRIGK